MEISVPNNIYICVYIHIYIERERYRHTRRYQYITHIHTLHTYIHTTYIYHTHIHYITCVHCITCTYIYTYDAHGYVYVEKRAQTNI